MHTACKSLKLSKTGPCFLSGIKNTDSKHDLLSIRKQCVYTDVCLLFILRENWVLTRPEVSRLAHRAGQGAEAGCTERGARCPKHTHTKRMTATKITQSINKKKTEERKPGILNDKIHEPYDYITHNTSTAGKYFVCIERTYLMETPMTGSY